MRGGDQRNLLMELASVHVPDISRARGIASHVGPGNVSSLLPLLLSPPPPLSPAPTHFFDVDGDVVIVG